jgi:hypothetical protein
VCDVFLKHVLVFSGSGHVRFCERHQMLTPPRKGYSFAAVFFAGAFLAAFLTELRLLTKLMLR